MTNKEWFKEAKFGMMIHWGLYSLLAGEYKGKSRLIGVITLEPGCSIGAHIHENEEEVFYIMEGTATYLGEYYRKHYT